MSDAPAVLVAVLNWNGERDTVECVRSVQAMEYPRLSILVVDNGSRPGSVAALRDAFPALEIVETGQNLGYAGGNNVALKIALDRGYSYCLVLNNDTVAPPDMASRLLRAAEADPRLAILGPRVYRHDRPDDLFYSGWKIDWKKWLFTRVPAPENPPPVFDVDFVQGCAMLLRADFLRGHGLFDERFHLYCEDADLCARAQRAGLRTVEVADARILHKGYASAGAASPLKAYYGLRNRMLFIDKHAPAKSSFGLKARLLVFDALPQALRALLGAVAGPERGKNARRLRALVRAEFDHLKGKYGPGPDWLFTKQHEKS